MANQSTRSIWPFALIALLAIGIYTYVSVEVGNDPSGSRESGGLAELEALAGRTDTNVLFVLVDTLRAERMSAYGYERATTPFLEKLAETGVRFDRHIAQSSWTKTSMASMWSSLNPVRAGITKFDHTVSSQIRMPAEILSEAGFKTVGLFRNGWVSGYFGFDQGFEKYYRPMGNFIDPQMKRMRPNAGSRGTDENLIRDAIEFLRIYGDNSRWFLYLHLMDLHEYTYDEESAQFGNRIEDLYDNSLLRTDWILSNLYEYMATKGLLENTIVVVLSDHGEAFGERGFEGHARSVYPETTETPLIISFPFALEPAVVVRDRTTNVDVWPTLLDLLGLPNQGEIDGRSRKQELLNATRGGEGDTPSAPLIESEDDYSIAFLDENWGQPGTAQKPSISVVHGPYRYVSGTDSAGRKSEVLLSTEDGQLENHIEEHPEIAEALRAQAQSHLEMSPAFESDTIELDEMQLDQLRALGYKLP